MDKWETLHHPNPTAVLRGGHFDGLRICPTDLRDPRLHPKDLAVIATTDDGKAWVYRPTAETDSVHPALAVYALDHAGPAASA